jgi:hypothetical protein
VQVNAAIVMPTHVLVVDYFEHESVGVNENEIFVGAEKKLFHILIMKCEFFNV